MFSQGGYDKGPRVVKKLKRADGPPKHELGTPNPNVYKTTIDFGWPLTWITWEHSWNQAAGDDETELGGFQLINFVIHTLAILTPLSAQTISRARRRTTSLRSDRV